VLSALFEKQSCYISCSIAISEQGSQNQAQKFLAWRSLRHGEWAVLASMKIVVVLFDLTSYNSNSLLE
jgi:hypothetical protein